MGGSNRRAARRSRKSVRSDGARRRVVTTAGVPWRRRQAKVATAISERLPRQVTREIAVATLACLRRQGTPAVGDDAAPGP